MLARAPTLEFRIASRLSFYLFGFFRFSSSFCIIEKSDFFQLTSIPQMAPESGNCSAVEMEQEGEFIATSKISHRLECR